MNTVFELKRLVYFSKRQLYLNLNLLWIAIMAVFGTLLAISILFAYFSSGFDTLLGLRNLYLVVFFLSGFVFTSMVFNELNSPKRSYAFLLLPASTLEKLVGAWLISSPVFMLLFGACMALLLFTDTLLAGMPGVLPQLFDKPVWICAKVYLVTQTLFFLGACTFWGRNFLKTLLALLVFALVVGLYASLSGYLLFGNRGFSNGNTEPAFQGAFEYVFTQVIPFVFWYLLGPFLLVVSYFKLKERQV